LNASFLDTFAFAVNNPHRIQAGFQALGQIIFQKIGNIPGPKGVQIQVVFDGDFDRFHRVLLMNTGDQHSIVLWLFPLFGYLLGSIPWGVVLTRLFGSADIRQQGSGNIGATNVSRVAGPTLGLLTFAGDLLKGAVPVYLALKFAGQYQGVNDFFLSFVGLAAFFGHLYPLFMKFHNGGKGVATTAGCMVVLAPLACLAALSAFIVCLLLSRRVSAGSLAAAAVLPIGAWFSTHSPEITVCAAIMSVFIFIRHRDNIKRLVSGTEPTFRDRQ
jgi:glycerol-3-phosphate acyltransferase PlsY